MSLAEFTTPNTAVWLINYDAPSPCPPPPPLLPKVAATTGKGTESKLSVTPIWGDLCGTCARECPPRPSTVHVEGGGGVGVQRMDESNVEGRENMVDLADLAVGELMHNLRLRYKATPMAYYTYVGEVLVVVNPLEDKGLVTDQYVEEYAEARLGDDPPKPPHIFAMGAEAYARMRAEGGNQSIVISGESGAGKSESTKHVLQFLAGVAKEGGSSKGGGDGPSINDRIIATSEVLEAFGNAKTSRNDNSSRFGKFVQIQFGRKGDIVGASIQQYLLEKSRIVSQEPGERNYHIFYMMFAALTPEELGALHLSPDVADYTYLIGKDGSNAGSYGLNKRGEDMDDGGRYASFVSYLSVLGLGPEFVHSVFTLMAAVLHLGQIQFRLPPSEGEDGRVSVVDMGPVEAASELLQMPGGGEALVGVLTTLKIGNASRNLTVNQASDTRDALAKAVYATFFEGLVEKIVNDALSGAGAVSWIGVLDIFGFESFEETLPDGTVETSNRFEQMCINLTNEVLQHFFLESLIPVQAAKYAAEGINVDSVEYADNQGCIDLLMSSKSSLLTLLNSVTKMASVNREFQAHPGKADAKWLADMVSHHGKRSEPLGPGDWKSRKSDFFGWHARPDMKHNKHETDFFVYHYAGRVWYTSADAVSKNADAVSDDVMDLLRTAKEPTLALVLAHADAQAEEEAAAASSSGGRRPARKTVASKFVASLHKLQEALESTRALFVRCVKPNCTMTRGGFFEDWKVLEQLVSAGMYAIIEMRLAGYPVERSKSEFVSSLAPVLLDADPEVKAVVASGDVDKAIAALLEVAVPAALERGLIDLSAPVKPPDPDEPPPEVPPPRPMYAPEEMYAVGHTKIMLKDKMWQGLSALRAAAVAELHARKKDALMHVQALARFATAHARLPELREAAAAVARRNEKKRTLIASGMDPEEAEAALVAEEEAAFRAKVFDPVEASVSPVLASAAAEMEVLSSFAQSALTPAEGDLLAKTKARVGRAQSALAAHMAVFSDNPRVEGGGETAESLREACSAAVMDARGVVEDTRASRARVIRLAEERRLEEIERLKEEKRAAAIAEARAETAAAKAAIEVKLKQRETERSRRLAAATAMQRKALAEARKLRAERQAFQLHLKKERMLLEEQEARARARRERRRAKAEAISAARTRALTGLHVKFESDLCVVKYVGSLPFPGSGEFVGLVGPRDYGEIGTSGRCMGIQFFACSPGHGIFVRPELVEVVRLPRLNVLDAVVPFKRGERVWRVHTHATGMVRYVGETEFASGIWVGIELDLYGSGKNDGTIDGVRYFDAPPDTGLFVRPDELAHAVPWTTEFVDAAVDEWCAMHGLWLEEGSGGDDDEDDEDLFARLEALQKQESEIARVVAEADVELNESELGVLGERVDGVDGVKRLAGVIELDIAP